MQRGNYQVLRTLAAKKERNPPCLLLPPCSPYPNPFLTFTLLKSYVKTTDRREERERERESCLVRLLLFSSDVRRNTSSIFMIYWEEEENKQQTVPPTCLPTWLTIQLHGTRPRYCCTTAKTRTFTVPYLHHWPFVLSLVLSHPSAQQMIKSYNNANSCMKRRRRGKRTYVQATTHL